MLWLLQSKIKKNGAFIIMKKLIAVFIMFSIIFSGAKVFAIAGPVILYGVVTSFIFGFIYWIMKITGMAQAIPVMVLK